MPRTDFNPLDYPAAWMLPQVFSGQSSWMEHIPFAFMLMQMLKPAVFVELGTWYGDSYFAFCQAVAQVKLPTRCYAVDHWQGDEHAGQLNSDAVFKSLREYHDPRFATFSELIRSTFDDAARRFQPGSIDLLHIDGLHTYEAVRHDYENWLPKLSSKAVVLFHDTDEHSVEFGVWNFWSEISAGRPHFEFLHGHGLGVLAVGADVPAEVLSFLDQAAKHPDRFRGYFAALGSRIDCSMAQHIFIRQTIALRELTINWARATGSSAKLSPFTPPAISVQPSDHSQIVLRDMQTLVDQAIQLYQNSATRPPTMR